MVRVARTPWRVPLEYAFCSKKLRRRQELTPQADFARVCRQVKSAIALAFCKRLAIPLHFDTDVACI